MEDNVKPIKIRPIQTWIHNDFKRLLIDLQTSRIAAGKESSQTKIPLWRLTKTISNLIYSNEKVYNSLVEVEINGVQY